MNITIIDGQGGQPGTQLIKEILAHFQNISITAIGTASFYHKQKYYHLNDSM